jgi:hypothetical protein
VGVLALRVEVFGRLDLDGQRLYFQQRAEKIAWAHSKARYAALHLRIREDGQLLWCGPAPYQIPVGSGQKTVHF